MLVSSVERCLEANCRLDVVPRTNRRGRPSTGFACKTVAVGTRIDLAAAMIEREVDRLTAELLLKDLERKKGQAA